MILGASTRLLDWIEANRDKIQAELSMGPHGAVFGREAAVQRILQSPMYVTTSWERLVGLMENLGADGDILREAQAIARSCSRAFSEKTFTPVQQTLIAKVIGELDAVDSDTDRQKVIDGALRENTTITNWLQRIDMLLNADKRAPRLAFSWAACGACGLILIETGVIGIGACIICGLAV